MTLKSVTIKNFRSIQKIDLEFQTIDNKKCLLFLGKNENGKSNILKAIALLNDANPVNYKFDCNKEAQNKNEPIKISFNVSCDEEEYKEELLEIGIPEEIISAITVISRNIEITKDNRLNTYSFNMDEEIIKNYVIANDFSEVQKISDIHQKDIILTNENIQSELPNYQIFTLKLFVQFLNGSLFSALEKNIVKVVFWQSSSQYLINEPINLKEFQHNSLLSIPLKNIFNIAGIKDEDITRRIEMILDDREARIELADTLADEITKYINSIWKEQKINIHITIDNDLTCVVDVVDKDNPRPKYRMDQRSDGFKQFISILLNLSAENATSALKNKIILLDEPEVHLHPSGIKYLRDELLQIAKNNIVLISTHSIYMVDKDNLKRHFSVIKNKAVTEIQQIEQNNPYMEEVIYESLGTSIYEHVTPNMIIFEGCTDKEFFDAFSEKFKNNIEIKNISAISARGANTIEKYVKFFNVALVKGFVVVDSDQKGREVKEKIIKDNTTYNKNNIFEILDLITSKGKKIFTLEDLMPKDIVEKCLQNAFNIEMKLDVKKPFIEQIKQNHKTLNEEKLKVEILKYVAQDLDIKTVEDIEKEYSLYYEFIKNLYEKIGR